MTYSLMIKYPFTNKTRDLKWECNQLPDAPKKEMANKLFLRLITNGCRWLTSPRHLHFRVAGISFAGVVFNSGLVKGDTTRMASTMRDMMCHDSVNRQIWGLPQFQLRNSYHSPPVHFG